MGNAVERLVEVEVGPCVRNCLVQALADVEIATYGSCVEVEVLPIYFGETK